jgi:nitrogen PTS system EIIA component
MKILDLLETKRIFFHVPLADKEALLWFVAEAFATRGIVKDADLLYEGIKAREETMSTGIGGGLAIPHAISGEAEAPAILILRLAQPLDFEALDGVPVDVVVSLVVPENQTELHLQILAALARLCQSPGFLQAVRDAGDPASLFEKIRRLEEDISFHS